MAGIGFELRKIFRKESVLSKIKGVIYASATAVGPMIIFLFMLLGINLAIRYLGMSLEQQLFFSSAILYLFVLAIIVSSALNTITSRYTSDMIYENKPASIPDAMYGSMFMSAVVTGAIALPACIVLGVFYQIPLRFLCGYYLLAEMASITYTVMTFISTIKEYKRVTNSFFLGLLAGIAVFLLLYFLARWNMMDCLLYGILAMFFIINIGLLFCVISFFPIKKFRFFSFLPYFKGYPLLFLSGLLYILGLYCSNIVYWFCSDISVKITIFHVAPSYDMATFIALLVNISSTVIFTVRVETQMYEKYRLYITSVSNASFAAIEKTRKNMVDTVESQLFYIYEVQLIITALLTCVAFLVFPMIGLGGLILDFFLTLGVGVYAIFSMYFTIVFLYYFDDQSGSCIAAAVFFLVTLVMSLVFARMGTAYYALSPVIGASAGWIFAFVRLKYILKHINARLFCKTYLGGV